MNLILILILSSITLVANAQPIVAATDEPTSVAMAPVAEASAQTAVLGAPSPNVRLSLITCQPGNPMYSKYGHTAIHLVDSAYNLDYIFNYGVFDFNEPHFLLHFISGLTDYQLDVEPTWFFFESCYAVGRFNIYEQQLNLTYEQRCAIIYALMANLQPQNKFYRYNFVFKNCSTQAYHIILRHLGDSLLTPEFDKRQDTFRDLINYYSGDYTWGQYSINLLFGREADRLMKPQERLFLPEQLMNYCSEARFASTGEHLAEDIFVGTFYPQKGHPLTSPLAVELAIALLCLILAFVDYRRRRISWWLDAALLFLFGIFGLIIWYLSLFSSHPLVGENINMLWLNPLLLIVAIMICTRRGRQFLCSRTGRLIAALYVLGSFVAILFWGQHHPFVILPTAFSIHFLTGISIGNRRTNYPSPNSDPTNSRLPNSRLPNRHSANRHSALGRFPALLLALLISTTLSAEPAQLTVVALVEGLNSQALSELRPYWQQGGLRRLAEEAYHTDISFSQLCYGGPEMTATLLTGTYPDQHGIASSHYFLRQDRSTHYVFEDKQENGIGTDLQLSTRALHSTTVGDELRLCYGSNAKIYAIGLTPDNTLPLAGHSANACCWLDAQSQQWVSTTYYPEGLPTAADKANFDGTIAAKAGSTWTPRLNVDSYLHPTTSELRHNGFTYNTSDVLRHSPTANSLVIDLALSMQQTERMGTDKTPDLLLLELTVVSPNAGSDLLQSAEQEDMYLALNQDLGYLIEQLTKRIGADNLNLILVGKPSLGFSEQQLTDANLQVTHFDINRAAALLSTYLMAVYGHERWIDGRHEQHIFLNRTLIEQKSMSLTEVEQQVAQFLMEFDGVADAYPVWQIPLLRPQERVARLQHSCYKRFAGDIAILLEDHTLLFDSDKQIDHVIDAHSMAPLFILSGNRAPHPSVTGDVTELKNLILK